MKIYFNNLGVVTSVDTTGDSLRQGSVGVELEAHFDDVDNSEYTVTLNFTRSDGISISGLIMALDQSDSEVYNYKFMDPWFFAKAGTTTLSIYLRAADGTIKAQGQVTFSIEATDYHEEPTITVSQYNELVAAIQETNEAIEEKSTVSGTVENEHLVSLTIDGVTYRIASGGTTYLAGTGITINPNTDVIAVDTSWLNEQYASKSSVESIESLIPAQASSSNKLADRDFVNSSIATQTSNFLGTFNVVTDLGLTTSATEQQIASAIATKLASLGITPTNNDYVYIGYPNATVSTQYDQFDRYKFNSSVSSWGYEYTLNNSSFTAEQWAAILSGITEAKVSAYDSHLLDTNNPHSVTKAQIGLGNVDNTSDLDKPISNASQAALNLKADKTELPHLYRHSFKLMAVDSSSVGATIYVNIYTTSGTAFTLETLKTYLQNNGFVAGSGYAMDGNSLQTVAVLSHISYSSNAIKINGYNMTGDTSFSKTATNITSYTPVQVF